MRSLLYRFWKVVFHPDWVECMACAELYTPHVFRFRNVCPQCNRALGVRA
jgi:Zn finger protein HypA/HybF involved in hydrogenase expression